MGNTDKPAGDILEEVAIVLQPIEETPTLRDYLYLDVKVTSVAESAAQLIADNAEVIKATCKRVLILRIKKIKIRNSVDSIQEKSDKLNINSKMRFAADQLKNFKILLEAGIAVIGKNSLRRRNGTADMGINNLIKAILDRRASGDSIPDEIKYVAVYESDHKEDGGKDTDTFDTYVQILDITEKQFLKINRIAHASRFRGLLFRVFSL